MTITPLTVVLMSLTDWLEETNNTILENRDLSLATAKTVNASTRFMLKFAEKLEGLGLFENLTTTQDNNYKFQDPMPPQVNITLIFTAIQQGLITWEVQGGNLYGNFSAIYDPLPPAKPP
jgi:hypothetical protein